MDRRFNKCITLKKIYGPNISNKICICFGKSGDKKFVLEIAFLIFIILLIDLQVRVFFIFKFKFMTTLIFITTTTSNKNTV